MDHRKKQEYVTCQKNSHGKYRLERSEELRGHYL